MFNTLCAFAFNIRFKKQISTLEAANFYDFITGDILIFEALFGNANHVKTCLKLRPDLVNYLNDFGITALMAACANANSKGHVKTVETLLNELDIDISKGRSIDGTTALIYACVNGNNDIIMLMIDYYSKRHSIKIDQNTTDGYTAFMYACAYGNTDVVSTLLEYQSNYIDINHCAKNGFNALMYASVRGQFDTVQLLLKLPHIKVNQRENEYGYNAITWACVQGHCNIVYLLLDHKNINVNQQTKGLNTVLHAASMYGHTNIVNKLLEKNADPNIHDDYGNTALMFAALFGHVDIVKILIQKKWGTNLYAVNFEINSALYFAVLHGHTEIIAVLEKAMNDYD
jgi:ankyrin repeat protein